MSKPIELDAFVLFNDQQSLMLYSKDKINVALYGASAEMLVACKGALSALLLEPHVDKEQAIDYLREVIAKAEGRGE